MQVVSGSSILCQVYVKFDVRKNAITIRVVSGMSRIFYLKENLKKFFKNFSIKFLKM